MKNEIGEKDLIEIKENLSKIVENIENGKISWEEAIRKHSTDENNGGNGIIYNESIGDSYCDMKSIDKSLFIGLS